MFLPSNLRGDRTTLVSAAFVRLIHTGKRLLIDISSGKTDSRHFDDFRELLAMVPLTTDEYESAVKRLRNAMQYAADTETGAARYEVMLLVRSFAKRGH